MEPERRPSADKKEALETEKRIEDVSNPPNAERYIAPEVIQARFDLLRDLGPDEMAALNKRVVRKIDWHMMPCVTLMFLMKYFFSPISS
jgi:hypothetical protein